MDILKKIDRMLKETTTTADVETNTAKGSVDVIGDKKCKPGYIWCPQRKKCVPKGSGDGNGPRKMR